MPTVPMTTFVDYLIKAGPPKMTVVSKVKRDAQTPYQPAFDFWKQLRDEIVDVHSANKTLASLYSLTKRLTDAKKITAYPAVIAGYKKWIGRKAPSWFTPPSSTRRRISRLDIRVNAELGLEFATTRKSPVQRHVIKLYFKSDAPNKALVASVLTVLDLGLRSKLDATTEIGLLDVRRSKLFLFSAVTTNYVPLVTAEAASFLSLWNLLP